MWSQNGDFHVNGWIDIDYISTAYGHHIPKIKLHGRYIQERSGWSPRGPMRNVSFVKTEFPLFFDIQEPTWPMEQQSISFPKYVAKVISTREGQ
jgi:hypothetical protein